MKITPPHADTAGWAAQIKDAFGTSSTDFASLELDRLISSLGLINKAHGLQAQTATNTALAAMAAAQPENEMEAMLASQMVATHAMVMDLMGRTKRASDACLLETYGCLAIRLMRTFTAQTETMAKLQRGGKQTVRVEHVHVHQGGQAVVGTINRERSD